MRTINVNVYGFQISDAIKGGNAHIAYDSYMPIFDIFVAVESINQNGFYCYKGWFVFEK